MDTRSKHNRRTAFTLLEVMLALGLLVVLSVLAWPTLSQLFDNQRLRAAGDQVRGAFANARADAMTNGLTVLFRYQPDAPGYQLEALATDVPRSTNTAMPAADKPIGRLPENIVFSNGETAFLPMTTQAGVDPLSASWTDTPIAFYPNGTTSNAELWLVDTRGRRISLQLRGLTGVVTVSDITAPQEAPQ